MFNRWQFASLITRVLEEHDLHSQAAVNLLLGTAAQESKFGTYLRQVHGPALGTFQIEKATFEWLKTKFGDRFPAIKEVQFAELEWNLYMSILFARLLYLIMPEPLPEPDDIEALGRYWKKYYNTPLGAGTVAEFVKNYQIYVV